MLNHPIVGSSLNSITVKACQEALSDKAVKRESRNGTCYELFNQDVVLTNPKNRHLYIPGRKNNIYATIAETIWVLAGKSEIDPLLSFVLPRAKDFSDDGYTWSSAYGPILYYQYNQIENVVEAFFREGINTRRALMTIWNPDRDTFAAKKIYGIDTPKDIACTTALWYWVDPRNMTFNCKVHMRSNDIIWGFSNINVFEFTVLQELLLEMINSELGLDLCLGNYYHSAISLHTYDFTKGQTENIASCTNHEILSDPIFNHPISLPNGFISQFKDFFNDIYNELCSLIKGKMSAVRVNDIFSSYNVTTAYNQLYNYVKLVSLYLEDRCESRDPKIIKEEFYKLTDSFSTDLHNAVIANKFTPKLFIGGK